MPRALRGVYTDIGTSRQRAAEGAQGRVTRLRHTPELIFPARCLLWPRAGLRGVPAGPPDDVVFGTTPPCVQRAVSLQTPPDASDGVVARARRRMGLESRRPEPVRMWSGTGLLFFRSRRDATLSSRASARSARARDLLSSGRARELARRRASRDGERQQVLRSAEGIEGRRATAGPSLAHYVRSFGKTTASFVEERNSEGQLPGRGYLSARGESRTLTGLPPGDFESPASAIPPLGRGRGIYCAPSPAASRPAAPPVAAPAPHLSPRSLHTRVLS